MLKKGLLFLLILWLPLQAAAMPSLVMQCLVEHGPHGAPMHAQDGDHGGAGAHGESPPAGHAHDGHDDHGGSAGHFCCHHFSALPLSDVAGAADSEPVHVTALVLSPFKFFPEPQRRPPRA